MSLDVERGELLAVDFDGTLTDPDQDEWRPAEDCEPQEQVIDLVREAYFDGAKVIVWTARQWTEASQIAGWLDIHEVPYHGLRCGKGGAEQYLDDKTVPTEDVTDDPIGAVYGQDDPIAATFTFEVSDEQAAQMRTMVGDGGEALPDNMTMDGARNY